MTAIANKRSFKDTIILLIVLLIGFQAFPIIKVGGVFKIYELLALILLFIELAYIEKFKIANNVSLAAGCFFVLSPIISCGVSYIFLGYPAGFYHKYPDAASFKFNYYIFPVLQLVYMFFNFTAFNAIVLSKYIYDHFISILKAIVLIGSFIAACSLFALFVKDLIILLPSFIQNKSYYDFRSSGFSQEPSFYILYQAWICLICFFTRSHFDRRIWFVLMAVNALSLVLTFSTSMAGFLLTLACSPFIFKTRFKIRLAIISTIVVVLLAGYFALIYFDIYPLFEYIFVSKITSFFSVPETTTDSGAFRSYTSSIGIRIFKDHWLTGVGVGNSMYYMYIYEFKMGIKEFGETLSPGIFPLNSFSSVLADQGIIGGGAFVAFLFTALRQFWINKNKSRYHRMFLLGTLYNFLAMLSIAPTYSLYLWVFIALGLCYVKYFNAASAHTSSSVIADDPQHGTNFSVA